MPNNFIERYNPSSSEGLNSNEVKKRKEENLTNVSSEVETKTFGRILRENFFTLFNILNLALALSLIIVRAPARNTLFMGVVVLNVIIGAFQEIRAKKAVDNLSLLSSKRTVVIRNSKEEEIDLEEIVLDDVLVLKSGDQVPADLIVLDGMCEVNESLLTGESNSIAKKSGDNLLSGSYLVSGSCKALAEKIGDKTYVSKISKNAKYIKKINSQIFNSFNKIILVISFLILPLGSIFFIRQIRLPESNIKDAVTHTVAGLVGMIPEGIVLLTSSVLAISIIRLSKSRVLVQDLYCIETLARVDVLCLDKTGTITEGKMEVVDLRTYSCKEGYLEEVLANLVFNLEEKNSTFLAIAEKFSSEKAKKANKTVPFSSERKYSGIYIKGEGSFVIGASEFVLGKDFKKVKEKVEKYSEKNRVLVLTSSKHNFEDNFSLPKDMTILGFVLLKDKMRKNVSKTLEFFENEGVEIKVISGDNVKSILSVAQAAGIKNTSMCVDMSKIKTEESLEKVASECTIFGRVSPQQKKQLILALKKNGKTVAMTGDGVNDTLALKESDCSIAMASGSEATRNISQIVLLDSDFKIMPKIVAEGRRAVNNIQRTSSLFLVKTIYSLLLVTCFLFLSLPFPFKPIQITLTTAFTVGIPSFILSLEPNKEKIKGNFLLNIIGKALPGAITVVFSSFILSLVAFYFKINSDQVSTMCVLVTAFVSFMVLFKVCTPFNTLRKILFSFLASTFCFLSFFEPTKEMFSLSYLGVFEIFMLIISIFISFLIFRGMLDLFKMIATKGKNNGLNG